MRFALPIALLGLAACQEQKVMVYNTPPAVSIVSPVEGQSFNPDELVEFYGVAEDSQESSDTLLVSWSSNLDGVLGSGTADSNGEVYLAVTGLSGGDHAITLTAVDSDGESANASVQITVGYGSSNEGAPTVIITGPSDGTEVLYGEDVTFVGVMTDDEQPWDTLDARLVSDIEGFLWEGAPESGGVVSATVSGLAVGTHTISLVGEDAEGHTGSADVTVTVLEDGRPTSMIVQPTSGDSFATTETIVLEGVVDDGESDVEEIAWVWESSLDGILATDYADSSGSAVAAVALTEGTHVLTLTAIDTDGKEASDTVTVTVRDANNVDDDGDGYTENEGDCDDGDATTSPGASEVCDDADNDCDGEINETFLDDYEANESTADAYNLGEVDGGFLWSGDSAALAGLTLHTSDDVDCFRWDADDEWYDNISISVTVQPFSSAGSYVVRLYMKDGGTWDTKDSDSGSSVLRVSYEGDLFETDEDEWAICVSATAWDESVCDGSMPYEIEIDS